MSTENWLTNVGTGALTGATIGGELGGGWGALGGGILGAGIGVFGATEADKADKNAIKDQDPTTPYKVTLPSGATVTMYAHGKPVQRRQNQSSAILRDSLNTAATLTKDTKKQQPAATDTAVMPASQNATSYIPINKDTWNTGFEEK